MAGEIATAFVSIMPSFKGGASSLTSQLTGQAGTAGDTAGKTAGGKFSGAFGSAVKGVGASLAGAFAVSGAVTFFKGAIQGASDLNETVSKSRIIFGEEFDAIDRWASNSATKLGLPKQAALEAAAGFGDMFTQIGFAGDEAARLSQSTVNLAADLGSFNNLPTEDVAQRISAAFRGEYDSLQTLIPNINAARVESAALAKTGKKTAKELTAQEKAAAVLAIVHADGAKAAGDFERTSDGLANKQKILSARFADVKTRIGSALIPVMNTLVGVGVKVIDFFERNSEVIKGVLLVLGPVVGVIGTIIGITKAWAIAQGILNAVMAANPITLVVVALVALAAGLIYAYKHSETFRNIVNGVFEAVSGFIKGAWENVIKPAIDGIVLAFQSVVTWAQDLWAKVTAFWTLLSTATGALKDAIVARFNEAVAFLSGIPARVVAFLTGLWNFIATQAGEVKDDIIAAFNLALDWVEDLPGKIFSAIGDLSSLLFSKGVDLVAGLIRGFQSMLGAVKSSWWEIMQIVGNAIPGSPVKEGPLKVLNRGYAGGQITRMIADGMLGEQATLARAAGTIAGTAGVSVRAPGGLTSGRRLQSQSVDAVSSGNAPTLIQNTYFPYREEGPADLTQLTNRATSIGVLDQPTGGLIVRRG